MLIETGRPVAETGAGSSDSSAEPAPSWPAPLLCIALVGLLLGALELQTSWLQSRLFSSWARKLTYSIEPGAAPDFRHPHSGPYDIRLGHSLLAAHIGALTGHGFAIESQARLSPAMARLMDWGLTPPYAEKAAAGLHISDRQGQALYASRYPGRIYQDFDAIPPLIVDTLLFIENREALDSRFPYKNPAVEWDRLANAALDLSLNKIYVPRDVSGGSTLATQIEKTRHSAGGRTESVEDKARQMISASVRAYDGGLTTLAARRRIVTDYLNSMPLAAIAGYGEVYGLGDGVWAWFDADFELVNHLLSSREPGPEASLEDQALAYRQVLTLLLSIKKPTAFLLRDRQALEARVDGFLRVLAGEGIIPAGLRDRALAVRVRYRERIDLPRPESYARRKATDAVRIELLQTLGINSAYDLDRLDLSVESTLDRPAQRGVADFLENLNDAGFAARSGLDQYRLLEQGDPAGVIYSVTVYERGPGVNYMRIQSDNLNQPLNISEGTKLELGSTAKLRTLASYLEAVASLHDELAPMDRMERAGTPFAYEDRISRWAVEYLDATPDATLDSMLEAALERRYSASPGERFFTGGGLHRFSNFDSKDNGRMISVREGLANSVNLVFIRLMRDLVYYRSFREPGVTPDLLTDQGHPRRVEYLRRFAEREGRQYLTRYYQKYEGLKLDEALQLALGDDRKTPRRLAAIYRYVRPEDGVNGFAAFLIGKSLNPNLSDHLIEALYKEFAPGGYSLADRAYIAGVNPLELWLLQYKSQNPGASLGDVFRESGPYCQVAYNWLLLSKNRRAQNRAIRIMLEVDAFRTMHKEWQSLGYPFHWLVPSYATALGSSGDTPAALAELVGIIVNDGFRYPSIRIGRLRFAEATPFETGLVYRPAVEARVMRPEVAAALRRELIGVVEHGTGRRALGTIVGPDGEKIAVGGKTGTGDNRYQVFGPGGRLIESRVINRTATFVFLIGDRFFGTVTAFVPGEAAAEYGFTSSLPVQIFKELAPALSALMAGEPIPDLVAEARGRPLPEPKTESPDPLPVR